MKIATSAGPSFYIRVSYLTCVTAEELLPHAVFTGEEENDILAAGEIFSVEQKALTYLNRAEQSRFLLFRKLAAKGADRVCINRALDYLESRGYLSDRRYSRAWLHTHAITKSDGRFRLEAELAARGINRDIVRESLDNFFAETSEEELCRRAFAKCRRIGKDAQRTIRYLTDHGFARTIINKILAEQLL
ncbi:MAG: recombination regulator RecX [Treponema sp.]|jgi:regulatory protein|nr:recombination regulator RecX [Treponema sp.]